MKNILFILLTLFTFSVNAQQTVSGAPIDSATTQNKIDVAKNFVDQAYIAYTEGNLEKSKYFVDQSQREGQKTGDFYYLLGAYMYRTNKIKAAKRYWNIAHKEGGCWECKEYLDMLKKNEPLEEKLMLKAQNYVGNLKSKTSD